MCENWFRNMGRREQYAGREGSKRSAKASSTRGRACSYRACLRTEVGAGRMENRGTQMDGLEKGSAPGETTENLLPDVFDLEAIFLELPDNLRGRAEACVPVKTSLSLYFKAWQKGHLSKPLTVQAKNGSENFLLSPEITPVGRHADPCYLKSTRYCP
jgi:hypothetical protein